MEKLRVNLFGKLAVALESGTNIEIEGRKAQELFCFLLLFRQQSHSRDVIADSLWRDHAGDLSRSYLRRTLCNLQNSFDGTNILNRNIYLTIDR